MGNIKSVCNALKYLGAKPVIAKSPSDVKGEKIIIPGVGAFGKGMNNLKPFIPKIRETLTSSIPLLGICLGLEMFFEGSEESPRTKGLELMKGKVIRIGTKLRLPHIGWNSLEIRKRACPLFQDIDNGYAYFIHSYHALPEEDVLAATTNYGCKINASVWKENIFGTQFHPEKSGALGLQVLKNFLEL
ncbi:MAG: imidazole glycerol phosphate synthase subunit HisH [Candidatus Bathyarchaeota archaeon]|nr:imidazole glycerol phosphate synthase subunit HisH [Candidatus Bathyarchaeota archaeon]